VTQNCYRFVRSRRTRLIVAGVSASALGLLAWCFFHPQQLVQGKPLRYWRMRLEAPLDSENRREVCQVFEGEGTNAMPLLIAAINARPSLREWASSRLYMRFGDKLPGGSEAIRRHFEQTDLRDSLRIIAMGTLIHLGSSAAPAVPALARILDDPGDPMTGLAMNVLAHIGERAEPAIPALIRVVQREERPSRTFAAR